MSYKPPKRRRLTPAQREQIFNLCEGRCAYCGCVITLKNMQVDHLIPMELEAIARHDGHDADSMDNMLPACRSYNNYKSSLTLEKFRMAVYRWPDVLMRDSVTYKNAARFGQVIPNQHVPKFFFEKIGVTIPALEWYREYENELNKARERAIADIQKDISVAAQLPEDVLFGSADQQKEAQQ